MLLFVINMGHGRNCDYKNLHSDARFLLITIIILTFLTDLKHSQYKIHTIIT